MKLAAPIPGMSLTKEPGNSPWEQPPLYDTPEKALSFYMEKFEDEESLDDLLFNLEAGFPVETMVDFLTSYSVMEGYHTVDVKMLVSPLLHEYFVTLADTAGIEYREEMGPTKDERMQEKEKQRAKVLLLKAMDEEPEQIAQTIKEVDAAPVTPDAAPMAPAPAMQEAPMSEPMAEEAPAAPLISRPVPRMAEGGLIKKPEVAKAPVPFEKPVEKPKIEKPKEKRGPALAGEPIPESASIGQVLNALAYAAGSSDKSWGAVKTVKGGKKLLGRYQAPADKIPAWTEEAVSRKYTAEEFLKSSETQQAVAMHRMAHGQNQYGSWEDAASVWFTGKPLSESPNGAEYANKFRQGYKRT